VIRSTLRPWLSTEYPRGSAGRRVLPAWYSDKPRQVAVVAVVLLAVGHQVIAARIKAAAQSRGRLTDLPRCRQPKC
jgi:hypothetical protein